MQYGVFPCKIHAKKLACKFFYASSFMQTSYKFACIIKVTDFACKNTCKLKVFLYNSKYGWWHLGENVFSQWKRKQLTIHFFLLHVQTSCFANQQFMWYKFLGCWLKWGFKYNTLFYMLTWMHVTCHANCCFEISSTFWTSVHCSYRLAMCLKNGLS